MMPYTKLQFIGYAIDTAPTADTPPAYLGLDDARQDVEARCQLMQRAMNTAAAKAEKSSDTLKLFVAPEFFFRGNKGAYEMKGGVTDVDFAVARLQAIAAAGQWKDWVFGFGTIVGAFEATANTVVNFALIQQGGLGDQSSSGSRIVMKERLSTIDFIDDASAQGLLSQDVEHLAPINRSGPGREQRRYDYDGSGIFKLNGLTWGVEICLDHTSGVTQGRLLKSPQLPGEDQVQVQLLPSCGAGIDDARVVAETDGYVFNVDGKNAKKTVLKRVGAIQVMTEIAPAESCNVGPDTIDLPDASPPRAPIGISQLYRAGAGAVAIYKPVYVPPADKVPGTVTTLSWKASADYNFTFNLAYDGKGRFVTALCTVASAKIDFFGFKYLLPLLAARKDVDGNSVNISIDLIGKSNDYDRAIRCKINVPGFTFEGVVVEFDNDGNAGKPPKTAW